MFNIIEFNNKNKWNNIVKSFEDYDIYYTHEYVAPFAYFENSTPLLLYYKGEKTEICYVVEMQDISKSDKFKNSIECQKYFDIFTPYGYGGPLVKKFCKKDIADFFNELYCWADENNIVSQFLRFHPLNKNYKYFENFCSLRTFKKTVYIDLSSPEIVYKNMNDKCRNMIKKAESNNLNIVIDNSKEAQSVFKKLYNETMQKNSASAFYYFDDTFFENLFKDLGVHCNLFNAKYNDGITVSSALIYEGNKYLHYHLSCSNMQYSKLGANNLLLYEVSKYGCKKGYRAFHLGGGVEAEDGLFIFKKSFNKNGLLDFYIGRNIFNKEKYDFLMNKRKELDSDFDLDTNYLIGYRS